MKHLATMALVLLIIQTTPHPLYGEDEHDHTAEADSHDSEEKHSDHAADEKHSADDHHAESDSGHAGEDHSDHDEHSTPSSVGPGKAVVEVQNDGRRFKLSKEAETFLGIKVDPIKFSGGESVELPAQSLVEFQDKQGIFVKDGDFFELLPVTIRSRTDKLIVISAHALLRLNLAKLSIAVSGLGMLRATHLQLTGQGGQGHAH